MTQSTRPGGRQREARRNDDRVIAAAREVFTRDPAAKMAAVADAAGVGKGSLYRRYRSKEELLYRVCADGMEQLVQAATAALERPDVGLAFEEFLGFYLRSGAGPQLTLAGSFPADRPLFELAGRTHRVIQELLDHAAEAGAVRTDVNAIDLSLLIVQISSLRIGDAGRTSELRERYLGLVLQALRPAAALPLAGPAPTQAEIERAWASDAAAD
ncbi:TetR/AcrR family transcriptional regulator [Pseudonocardia acaciae]|uniref:TetR/AcrR family transcriptional regulator n=1 Tax=Pseudonocardia acaciae TaxID=551276 RepID=UPI0005672C7D|nr:TetR family transcriptional regulator [Pseudonocardia acaciae]